MPHPQNDRPSSDIYLGEGERTDLIGPDGLPQVHLVEQVYDGEVVLRFCDDASGELMTAEARRLTAAGIWAGKLRGRNHYADAARRADLRPGRRLVLVRQSDNPHDAHAVAVTAAGSNEVIGFIDKAKARQLAKQLDGGVNLSVVSLAGTGPGVACGSITYAAAMPEVIAHITGLRPNTAARPAHWA
ncbi:HIRAN domain-containing protein [Yimella sp. NH-Cas1]|uniref:HIRAN domain-containing protein n=1 Tax=Yimella sp. NH-Cas1 TaxID=2917726 RepID=UPI001EFC01F5|nr:HIRAN domain-containing protein [Yimella sp. NH-Cas1]MCG8656759.1 HIRAN domain-containing protein [Yimella sp. NH-Cas1]